MSQNDTQIFNKDEVSASMNKIGGMFEKISSVYTSTDQQMAAKLTTPDGAMYGAGATKILSAWDENSGTLDDFMNTFENWSAMVSGMANQFTNLQEGTYLVKDADVEKISASAVANRTTALKTTEGSSSYNAAQTNYRNNHKEFRDIDENGIHYQSFKQVENGRIVETKVFKDDNDNLYAEVTHWDNEKGEYVTEYFEGGKLDGLGNYITDTSTRIDKKIFDDKYFSTKNREEMANNWKYKYGAEYLEKGDISQMSEEARAAYERLPEDQRKALSQEMADLKKQLDEDNAVYKYNEKTGKLESVTYTDKDGIQYKVEYDSETGNPKYYRTDGNGNWHEVQPDDIGLFYDRISNSLTNDSSSSANPSSGTGNTGSNPSGNTGSVVVDPGNNSVTYSTTNQENNKADYTMSKDGNNLYIESDGVKYYISYDQDGNRIYKDQYGFQPDQEKVKELDQAYNEMTNNSPYAAALANETTADGKTYSFDQNGDVVSTQEVKADQIGEGTLTTTYDKDGNPTNYHYEGEKDGKTVSEDIALEDIEGYLNGEVKHADGSVSTYNVDFDNNTVTITTEKDGQTIKTETRTAEGKTIEEYEYDDPNSDNPTKIVETITDKDNNVISKNTKDEITYDDNDNPVGYKETTADGTETYKYKDPDKDAKDADAYVPVSKEQYDRLKEQQSGDPNSKYTTKYEIKDGHYTETECEKTSAGEKVLKETTQDENGVTTQIKENQYDENDKLVGYSIDHTDGNKEYYQADGTEVGRENYYDETYEYLDKSSPDGAFVKVDKEKFDNLIAKEKTDGNTTVTYKIENGNYVETTTYANDPDKTTITTTIKKGNSEEKITKTEENGNVTYSYQGEGDKTSKDVNLDENEYNNIIKGSSYDESTGKTTEYSIENGHYTETEKKDDKVTAVNTKPNGKNAMVREEYAEDGTTVISRTCGNTSLTEQQAENVIRGETEDGTRKVQLDEDGYYVENEYAKGNLVYSETQNSKGAKIHETTNTYNETTNKLETTETINYDKNNTNQKTSRTLTTYGDNNKVYERITEKYEAGNVINTNTKTYHEDGTITEVNQGTNRLESEGSGPGLKDSKMTTEYGTDGKTITKQTLVTYDDKGNVKEQYSDVYNGNDRTRTNDTQKYTQIEEYKNGKKVSVETNNKENGNHQKRELINGVWQVTERTATIGNQQWGYDKNGIIIPEKYKNNGYNIDEKIIDAIIESEQPPVLTNSVQSDETNSYYTDYLNNGKDGEIVVFKKDTVLQYDMTSTTGYDINDENYSVAVKMDKDTAYKIVGDKLVNVDNPNEWYYLDVLKKASSRDNYTDSSIKYEDLQKYRDAYHLTKEDEQNLKNKSPKDILKNSYDDFSLPDQGGYNQTPKYQNIDGRPTTYDPKNKNNDGNIILNTKLFSDEPIYAEDVKWYVKINNIEREFIPTKINGKIYYTCRIDGQSYIYDPKTGNIYD